ncbi:MAG: hypothetical protein P8X52_06725, partial [Limibacillus sp.]
MALTVVAPADHGAQRPVRGQRHQGGLTDLHLRPALQRGLQLLFGQPLQTGVQGGLHDQVAVGPAEEGLKLLQHPVREVARPRARHREGRALAAARAGGGLIGDEAGVHHGGEHDLGALLRCVAVVGGGKAGGRLQKPGQKGCFVERHLARGFPEVAPGGGVHAVGPGPQIDEGLEGAARLALGLGRAVELALTVVAPADHGAQRPVRGQRHQGGLTDLHLRP